jgi:hypothetical protein
VNIATANLLRDVTVGRSDCSMLMNDVHFKEVEKKNRHIVTLTDILSDIHIYKHWYVPSSVTDTMKSISCCETCRRSTGHKISACQAARSFIAVLTASPCWPLR